MAAVFSSPARAHDIDSQALFERLSPSVVTVHTYNGRGRETGSGTGFFVGDGSLVVTCRHVIRKAERIAITLPSGRKIEVTGVTATGKPDLAVLRTGHKGVALELASAGPAIGEEVIVISNPEGFLNTLSWGLVSGLRTSKGRRYVQITAAISPGSSGAPVLSADGEVIGVVSFLMEGQSLNFAASASHVAELLRSVPPLRRTRYSAAALTSFSLPARDSLR